MRPLPTILKFLLSIAFLFTLFGFASFSQKTVFAQNCNTTYCAECSQVGTQCLVTRSCPEGFDPATPNFCYDPTGSMCTQGPLYSDCVQTTPPPGTQQCPTDHPNCTDLTGSLCNNAGGISQSCPLSGGRVGSCCVGGPTPDPDPDCGSYCQIGCGTPNNYSCDSPYSLTRMADPNWGGTGWGCCSAADPTCSTCSGGTISPPPVTTPEYRSSSGRWAPNTNPPGYYAPDYPSGNSKEHLYTPGERAIPNPPVSCSGIGSEEFHSLRPYQASPCYYALSDIALMCANRLTLEGDYAFSPSDCTCNCGGCECSASGQASGCTCYCNCDKTFTLSTYVDVFDAELPIMGNTEDKVVNSQDQPDEEGIDHYAKVNEYVSWYLSGVNQRAEYGSPDGDYVSTFDIVNFSGPVNRLLPWDRAAGERNDQVRRARRQGDPRFDLGGRHNQIVACQSEPGVGSACYTDGGQRIRIRNWSFDDVPLYSNYDSEEEYNEAWQEWVSDPENALFGFIPMSSTEDRYGELQGTGNVYVIGGGNVTNQSVFVRPAELFYPHLEEGRELTDLLQKTFVSKDFIERDRNGDGIPDIDVTKTKHVIPANPPQCDLTRVRTNPGDTINPTELLVTATFTVQTSCEVPGNADCDCDEDEEGNLDCICTCTPAGAVCPGGTVIVEVDLTNNMPLAQENFIRTVASPYSPLQRLFPKIGSNMPLQGIYDMPGYSLVNYLTPPGAELELTNVANPGGYPMPPKLFYPHIGSIHQYFLNCIQTALRPEGYGSYCEKGELNNEDWQEENPEIPVEPGDIVPPLPEPRPTDVEVVPYPTVPPVDVPESCRQVCGYPIEDLATTVFAETSNGAQTTETQIAIANVMYNRACTGLAEPYTGANTILYEAMYNQSGGSYPPPTGNQITNTHLALAQCLLNPTACPLQSTRFNNTLSIMAQVCMDRQAGQEDITNGSIFFSHQQSLNRPGISFNNCNELHDWLVNNMQNYQNTHPGFGYYVSPPTPDQRWVPGSTSQVYQFGCYVLITGTDICAVDAGCH